MGTNEILNMQQLSDILGYTVRQLQNYISRNQVDYYPPPMPTKPCCSKRWLKRVVEKWLQEKETLSVHSQKEITEKKKRGRPRKVAA